MRRPFRLLQLLLPIGIIFLFTLPLRAQDAELVRHFDYNNKAPLPLKTIGTEKRSEATVLGQFGIQDWDVQIRS